MSARAVQPGAGLVSGASVDHALVGAGKGVDEGVGVGAALPDGGALVAPGARVAPQPAASSAAIAMIGKRRKPVTA